MASKPEPKAASDAAPNSSGEVEKTSQELIVENLPAIAAVLVVLTVIALVWTYRGQEVRRVSDAAWRDLSEVKANTSAGLADYEKLLKDHGASDAGPYIRLAWASKLYESGERDNVEQARDLLKQVLAAHGDLPLVKQIVPAQLEQIEAELADPSVPWDAIKASNAKEAEDEAADDHADHDHPPGEHPEAPGE